MRKGKSKQQGEVGREEGECCPLKIHCAHVAISMQDFITSETTPEQGHQRKGWGTTRED